MKCEQGNSNASLEGVGCDAHKSGSDANKSCHKKNWGSLFRKEQGLISELELWVTSWFKWNETSFVFPRKTNIRWVLIKAWVTFKTIQLSENCFYLGSLWTDLRWTPLDRRRRSCRRWSPGKRNSGHTGLICKLHRLMNNHDMTYLVSI